jgi:hypothetical protein
MAETVLDWRRGEYRVGGAEFVPSRLLLVSKLASRQLSRPENRANRGGDTGLDSVDTQSDFASGKSCRTEVRSHSQPTRSQTAVEIFDWRNDAPC